MMNCVLKMMNSSGGFTEPATLQSGEPFNKPTDCWVDPKTGDIFITDGYGNSRVHRLKADGTPILSWGTPGTDAGEFQLVHNICGHPDGDKVVVCDRENSRVQVFDFEGNFISESSHHRAVSCAQGAGVNSHIIAIAEQGTHSMVFKPGGNHKWGQPGGAVPNIGNKVTLQVGDDLDDRIIQLGNAIGGDHPDGFTYLHGQYIGNPNTM